MMFNLFQKKEGKEEIKQTKLILNFFRPRSIKELEEEWLAESPNLVELERRQKQLINPNLKGWI